MSSLTSQSVTSLSAQLTGDGDACRSALEANVINAVASEVAAPGHSEEVCRALLAYVKYLRTTGAPPEAMIIRVKTLLFRSDLLRMNAVVANEHRADWITRCIAAYYVAD